MRKIGGLVKFAVCDFSTKEAIQLKNELTELCPEAKIDLFGDGESLINRIQNGGRYDMLFLDVFILYMKLPDGVSAIERIRSLGPGAEIVFTSVSRDYGPEAYAYSAFYYLVKPYRRDQLLEIKRRFCCKHVTEIEVYDSRTRQTCRLPYQKIIYIECVHNYLHIHLTVGAAVVVRESLTEFMKKLDDRFLRINRGVSVNMEEVEQMSTDSCRINGLIFMLSRRQRTENRQKYNAYMFRHHLGGDTDQ